jgi:dTDP-4-amino-4,6-dideoxygalactose transaminase
MSANRTVPFFELCAMHDEIRDELDLAWERVTNTSGFIGGDVVAGFERDFAAFCGVDHAVGVGSGTDALELIFGALGFGPGDEIIVPANTFVATAAAVVAVGATPVFVDVDPDTLLVTPEHVSAAITPRTVAVTVVHLYGQSPDMCMHAKTADAAGIALIEDAAQAHGALWRGDKAGSFGRAAAFSFYPSKNLGAFGDAGAVVTDDAALAARIRSLADHGRAPESRYQHESPGHNSRMDALQAAVLSVKLPRLARWNEQRRRAVARYHARLGDSLFQAVADLPDATGVYHLAVVQAPARDTLLERLTRHGIGWGLHYPVPCHRQQAFAEYAREPLPVVDRAADSIVSLPLFPTITDEQVDLVCDAMLTEVPA